MHYNVLHCGNCNNISPPNVLNIRLTKYSLPMYYIVGTAIIFHPLMYYIVGTALLFHPLMY